MTDEQEVVAAEGKVTDQQAWKLLYRRADGEHCIRLLVNGTKLEEACGFDIPDVTEIGFAAGLTPGQGHYFLYGLVTARIQVVRAESHAPEHWSEAIAVALPGATATDGTTLGVFVLVRPPIDDVTALVGLDRSGQVVQRIAL